MLLIVLYVHSSNVRAQASPPTDIFFSGIQKTEINNVRLRLSHLPTNVAVCSKIVDTFVLDFCVIPGRNECNYSKHPCVNLRVAAEVDVFEWRVSFCFGDEKTTKHVVFIFNREKNIFEGAYTCVIITLRLCCLFCEK